MAITVLRYTASCSSEWDWVVRDYCHLGKKLVCYHRIGKPGSCDGNLYKFKSLSRKTHIFNKRKQSKHIYYIYILYRYIGINAKIIGPTYLHTLLIMGAFVPASVFVFLFVEWYMWNVGENVSDGMCPYPQHFWSDSSFCGVQLYLVGCGCRDEDPRVA